MKHNSANRLRNFFFALVLALGLDYFRLTMRYPRQLKERLAIGLVVVAIAALVQGVRWLLGYE